MAQVQFGASVSARSVKLLSENTAEADRDKWWHELRNEIEQNALLIAPQDHCVVLGYREHLHVYDNLAILSAFGTAVKVKIPGLTKQ